MKAILTVLGKDRTGIIAGVSSNLAELNVNILDVNQTILGEYFTMFMLLDLSTSDASLEIIKNKLDLVANKLSVKIHLQREDIFTSMHHI